MYVFTISVYSLWSAIPSNWPRANEMSSSKRDDDTIALRVLRGFSSGSIPASSGKSLNIKDPISAPCVEPQKECHKSQYVSILCLMTAPGLGNSGQYQYAGILILYAAIRSSARLTSAD